MHPQKEDKLTSNEQLVKKKRSLSSRKYYMQSFKLIFCLPAGCVCDVYMALKPRELDS